MNGALSTTKETPYIALVGNPNCGKTALFNLLTGARQKVANYAGVTVERKQGSAQLSDASVLSVVDLPGTYSLNPTTADETVTHDLLMGLRPGEAAPKAIIAVVDATNLRMNLRLVLQLRELGKPMVIALNMMDVARTNGLHIDIEKLAHELKVPVIPTIAVDNSLLGRWMSEKLGQTTENGRQALLEAADFALNSAATHPSDALLIAPSSMLSLQKEVARVLAIAVPQGPRVQRFNHGIDAVVMHPVWGLVLLAGLLLMIFQAVFSWANVPMDAIKWGVSVAGEFFTAHMPPGLLQSLLVDGVIAGLGGVVIFLPQILILFFFILLLENSGYLPRAAFLLDNVMGKVGLSGRAFIPLLSSFACAIPGIMATRTIPNWRDRLATIMVAPLMTCSARLPLYALLIGAFVPARDIGIFNLQGLTLFGLYVAGIFSAMAVAWVFKKTWMRNSYQPLMLELPPYRMPNLRNLMLGLWQRAVIFLSRVGGIIFAVMVLLWFMSTFPGPPDGATGAAIQYSFAGMLGHALEPLFAPIGFNWEISIALVPGMAAREVAVGALSTVYALSANGEDAAQALGPLLAHNWSTATAYSLLAWYVFAPQCISTLVVVKRETNSWRYPALMAAYLFGLAYLASFITFRTVSALNLG